jgi:hypothetical protein
LGPDLKYTMAEIKLHRLAISELISPAPKPGEVAKFEAELSYDSLDLIVPLTK